MPAKSQDAPPTLADAIIADIRRDIVQGKLAPGAPLREPELCRSLGVSRVTVREALRRLQEEGLVTVFPHQGTYVTELSERAARELFTLRGILEPYAVRMATEDRAYSQKTLVELETLARQVGEQEARGEFEESLRTDMHFHLRLCEPSDHLLLIGVLRNLQAMTMMYANFVRVAGIEIEQQGSPHMGIVDAVRSGDADRAERAVREHAQVALEMILRNLAERRKSLDTDTPSERHPLSTH